MKLYICTDGSYAGTQADAKAKGKGWTQEEVPTDKEGLLGYLNALVDDHKHTDAYLDDLAKASPEPVGAPPARDTAPDPTEIAKRQASFTTGEIEVFILETATVSQVERVFACLGARFAESRGRR